MHSMNFRGIPKSFFSRLAGNNHPAESQMSAMCLNDPECKSFTGKEKEYSHDKEYIEDKEFSNSGKSRFIKGGKLFISPMKCIKYLIIEKYYKKNGKEQANEPATTNDVTRMNRTATTLNDIGTDTNLQIQAKIECQVEVGPGSFVCEPRASDSRARAKRSWPKLALWIKHNWHTKEKKEVTNVIGCDMSGYHVLDANTFAAYQQLYQN